MVRRIAARREFLLLVLIFAVGAAVRLYGLNWDAGHWLHPDERQIYFVTDSLAWPKSLSQALSVDSPLNPEFFAYGSLPFYLLKLVVAILAPLWPALRDSDNLHLAGRPLAALFDLGTIYLTYRLARILYPSSRQAPCTSSTRENGIALLAAALVSVTVLHIQLAHFYTVDPLLTFFVMLTLSLAAEVAKGGGRLWRSVLGIAFGLALASKVSAAPLLLAILVACSAPAIRSTPGTVPRASRLGHLVAILRPMVLPLVAAGIIFVVVQPYAVIDWRTFLDDTLRESQIAWGALDVPYTRQYAGTPPYLYAIWQTSIWSMALPVGIIAWTGLGASIVRWLRHGDRGDTLLLAWAAPYLAITGLLYTRYLRYMLPLTPILCILAALLITDLGTELKRRVPDTHRLSVLARRSSFIAGSSLILLSTLYALAFLRIYPASHTWIAASEWIYRTVPSGSTMLVEDWDVALPLPLDVDGQPRRIEEYDLRTMPLYDEPDDATKWQVLAADLAESDYLILASRRLYGSIPRLHERYPVTTRYYDRLFANDLGFEIVSEFTRGPAWLNPHIPPLPDAVPVLLQPDESFVVYDHPRTLIFRNTGHLSAEALLQHLQIQ